jgi:hypothetical protein
MLPGTLVLRARIGVHHPSLAGCLLHVKRGGLIEIGGPSREAVFDQVARFLRVLTKGMELPAFTIAARSSCSLGCDSWQIVIGADVAFMPGRIDPHLYEGRKAATSTPEGFRPEVRTSGAIGRPNRGPGQQTKEPGPQRHMREARKWPAISGAKEPRIESDNDPSRTECG